MNFKCKCGEVNPDKFYGHKRSICGKCQNEYVLKTGRENKRKMVEYLGGCCVRCGYNKCLAALDLHHTDPTKKDANWTTARYWSWKRIEKELEHCELLCSNCHREFHENLNDN